MLTRETEIIESFALIEMSPMLAPNLDLDRDYREVDQQCGSKCLRGGNFLRRGLILMIIARDQSIIMRVPVSLHHHYPIGTSNRALKITNVQCRLLFCRSLQSHFISDTLDRIFHRSTKRRIAPETGY